MDWKTFIANLIGEVAWPMFAAWFVWTLRKPIRELLPYLKSLKYKDLELEFDKKLDQASAKIDGGDTNNFQFALAEGSNATDKSDLSEFEKLAQMSTNAAVLRAWSAVETKLVELAANQKIDQMSKRTLNYFRNPHDLTKFLQHKNIIKSSTAALLDDLRELRNSAAHAIDEKEISFEQALRFKDLADHVTNDLERAQRH